MALVPVTTRNRISPMGVPPMQQLMVPYPPYQQVEICNDPNCSTCRAERHNKHNKRHHHHHHQHHHHHRKPKHSFWDSLLPREESASSIITVHNIELDERYPHYSTSHVNERALVPIEQTERQIVTTSRPRRIANDEVVREAWVDNPTNDDEIVCCRAYDGCRCPCWCCIILIVLFVILIIVLIVLLATLL